MNVTTGVNTSGTSLQGYLENVSFWELMEIFGEPEGPSGDGKTRVNWSIKLENKIDQFDLEGVIYNIATIYDWKNTDDILEVSKWNVGGNNQSDYLALQDYVNSRLKEIREPIYPGSDCQV